MKRSILNIKKIGEVRLNKAFQIKKVNVVQNTIKTLKRKWQDACLEAKKEKWMKDVFE